MSLYLKKEIYSVFIVQMFALFTLSIFGAYIGIHLNNMIVTATILAVVFSSRNIIQIFFRVPLSELSQIIGRKPLILLGIISYTLSLGLLFLATSWVYILLASILVGIGMSMHWPAIFSYIGDISDSDNYGRINGVIFQGQDIGIIIGSLLVRYLLSKNIFDLKGVFGMSFIIGIFGIILSFFILPEVLEEKNRLRVDSISRYPWLSFKNIFQNLKKFTFSPFGVIFAFETLVTFTEFFISSFFPLLIVLSLNFDKSLVATTILISTLVQIPLENTSGIYLINGDSEIQYLLLFLLQV